MNDPTGSRNRILMLLQQRLNQLVKASDEDDEATAITVETASGGTMRIDFPRGKSNEPDGPGKNGVFHHRGKRAVFSALCSRIVALLWEETTVDRDSLVAQAWEGKSPSRTAVWNAIHKCNETLGLAGMPLIITVEDGVVKLLGD